MKTSELQGLTVKELQKFAVNLGSTDSSGLLKQELIKEILEKQAKKKGKSVVTPHKKETLYVPKRKG